MHSSHGLWSKLRRVILTPKSGKGTGMVEKARELAEEHGWLLCHQFLGVKHAMSCDVMWRYVDMWRTALQVIHASVIVRTLMVFFFVGEVWDPGECQDPLCHHRAGNPQWFWRRRTEWTDFQEATRPPCHAWPVPCGISDRFRHPPGLLCHRLRNWRNLLWCWESSSGGEPSRLRVLMWQPGRLTRHDSHAGHEARIRWTKQSVLKKTICCTNHLKHLGTEQEKRPEVKLCLAEPADAPLVASGHKMDRQRVATGSNLTLLQRSYHFQRRCELMIDHFFANLCS